MSYKDEHERLLEDLARSIGTSFINVPLGSIYLDFYRNYGARWEAKYTGKEMPQGVQLADAIAVKPSYTRFCLSIYEVKVSRSDFLQDVRKGKWEGYLGHCHRFYFATPSGIITRKDIPEGAGWIVKGEKGWSTGKGSPVYEPDIPMETLLSMLFLKNRKTLREKHLDRVDFAFSGYGKSKERQAKIVGNEIAEAYAKKEGYDAAKRELESLASSIQRDLKEALGIDARWPEWELSKLVDKIKKKAKEMGIE